MGNDKDGGYSEIVIAAANDNDVLGSGENVWRRINSETLRHNLQGLLSSLGESLPSLPESHSEFRMTEITVAVTVGAKGQVGLLGTGVEANGQASLTIKLSRP